MLIICWKCMWNDNVWGILDYRSCYENWFPLFLYFLNVATWKFKIRHGLYYISSGQCCFISTSHGRIMAHVYFLVFSMFLKLKIWGTASIYLWETSIYLEFWSSASMCPSYSTLAASLLWDSTSSIKWR